jgi:Carboxypeptidase regulatory-like domain/FlgD Ig-like domain
MKSYLRFPVKCLSFFYLFIIISGFSLAQNKDFIGTTVLKQNGELKTETIPGKDNSETISINDYLNGFKPLNGNHYVLGGSVLWLATDLGTAAIANTVSLNYNADVDVTAWGLNIMRVSKYSNENNIPNWEFSTAPIDPNIDVAKFGPYIVSTAGTDFYIFDSTGTQIFDYTLPDSLYASVTGISRDGNWAVFLASSQGSSTTSRAYGVDVSGGSPTIAWTMDVPTPEIGNWTGVNFAANTSRVVINGRYHIYVLDPSNGNLIWDGFADNTESPVVISGDGNIIASADNSGFVKTLVYSSSSGDYEQIWQYKIPPTDGFTNWASSVGISADGNTIVAGTLMFYTSHYDGWVIAFDTYGDGTPKWIYTGAGDLVDDIAVSDDGRVAAAATWGDLNQTNRNDLLVFDVQTGQMTYQVTTPGSFFTCDISPDGTKVIAGGKAMHAREFGNGGRVALSQIDLGGGSVSGNVNLTNTSDNSGVLVTAVGTVRTALTDASGNYIIENVPAGSYTISAGKPGYDFELVPDVIISDGNLTSGINFSLNPFAVQPPVLSASNNEIGAITLNWILTQEFPNVNKEIEKAKAVGDPYPPEQDIMKSLSINEHIGNSIGNTNLISSPNSLADSIFIYRSLVSEGPYTKIGSVGLAELMYVDSSALPLKDYYYVVNVVASSGQSGYSNEALGQVNDSLFTFSLDVPQGNIPTIDGVISPGEWDDAFKVDISDVLGYGGGVPQPQGSVYMYFKFDDNTDMLYVAGEDYLNPTLDDNEGFGLYFDDDNNNVFNGNPPFSQEGNFWAYWHPGGSDLRFRDLNTFVITSLTGAQVNFSDASGHLQGEVAIPMGFMEGYQLQVYGPDKIVGLGAFIIARQSGNALFNGWWPQTMNSLFTPRYFGDVGIDVSLTAPPQAPSDIAVEKQGNGLVLTWTDPTLGINNDPLPSSPTINIYKNDEFLTSLPAGVQSLVDNDVDCAGWYEYKLDATIQVDTMMLTGPRSVPKGNFACTDPVLVPISYDDGQWDGFYVASFSWENNKFGVLFTPTSYPAIVRRLVTTTNSNDDFDFTVQADHGGIPNDTLAGPYTVNGANPPGTVSLITKNIPGTDPPSINSGNFWVVINWHEDTPGSPGIGADVTPPLDNRSYYYLESTGWTNLGGVDIMISAYVSDTPVGVEEQENTLPIAFDLKQNYPNPFNPSTKITYQIPQNQFVNLDIYDALGQKVRTLVNSEQNAGYYNLEWNGRNDSGVSVTSGVYFYRIHTDSFTKVMKMMLLK